MKTDHDRHVDRDLEAFFQAARESVPEASPDLMARVLADAYSEQDAREVTAPAAAEANHDRAPAAQGRGWFAGLLDALGGWPAVAGLATAAVAGVWIGYNPPLTLDTLSLDLFDSGYGLTMDSSLPDIDYLLSEG